ncbi:hypothetical protein SAMN04487839_11839 [Streptococcus gallolyticus]|uniref:TMP repeat-containing protein n=1 Tax=Streptococcus gallolyticus TaxID=315405 RepID=A0A1H7XUI6_9STRE|nr:hypothetical protein [Streptococcus gallolyticus]SEF25486.1 hypothetical protein SAMN02910295_0120 [Streptococcus gallolyticus]SEM36808.1 hypothetical protein SAMN04487839_11839 [Streptococcus gallolyticus]
MSMTLEELQVVIDAKISPFKQKMKELENQVKTSNNKVQNSTSSIKAAFSKIGKIAAFSYLSKKMLDLGVTSTQTALEVVASVNQIKRQMGESSQAFLKWIETNANAMNMSVSDATQYASIYGNLFAGFIKDSDKLSAYTGKMLQTSAVIAEGTGRSITDVMERIRSGLLGNTEAIEDLGINVNVAMIESTEAFKKYAGDSSWQQLDYNTQQQIRLMAILEQASAKFGNTLTNSVNSRVSLFKSLLKDTAFNLGSALLPILNAVMPVLNSLAMALKNATAKLAEFVSLMFNKKATVKNSALESMADSLGGVVNNANDAAGAVDDVADSLGDADDASSGVADNLDDTAKSAKKAVKELLGLAGFDEINSLGSNDSDSDSSSPKSKSPSSGSGKGGSGGNGNGGSDILPEVALEDLDNNFKSIFDGWDKTLKPLLDYLSKLKDLFKDGFNVSFRADSIERFKEALKGIWQSLKDIFEDGTVLAAAAKFGEKLAYALGQITGAIANVIMGIAVFIAESLNKSLNETKLDIKSWLIRQFEISGDLVAYIGNIAQALGQIFYDTITSTPATDVGSHIISAFTYAGMGIAELFTKYTRDWFGILDAVLTENQDKITRNLTGLLSAAEPAFKSMADFAKHSMEAINKTYDDHFKPYMDSLKKGWVEIVGTFLDSWNTYIQPVLDNIGQGFSDMISNHFQPMVDKVLDYLGDIIDDLKVIWENVLQPFFNWLAEWIVPILAPAIQYLADVFFDVWGKIADIVGGVIDILQGINDFLKGVFTGDWSLAWDGIKQIFSGFSTILESLVMVLWNALIGLFKAAWNTLVAIVQAGWDGIVKIFSPIGKWFGDRWNDIVKAFTGAGQWFTQKFQEAWTGLTNIFQSIGSWFKSRYNDVTNAFSSIGSWFGNTFRGAWSNVTSAFSGVANFFRGIYNTIKNSFTNIGTAIGSAVSGAFRSAMNSAFSTVENVVNSFIGMINGVIGVINKIPGVSLGRIGRVYIPKLARGGIVDSPTLAMIGEAGKEAVVPLENTGFLQTMGRVVSTAVVNALGSGNQQSGFSGDGDIIIQIGGSEFGRIAIKEINKEQQRAGQILLKI